MAIVAHINDKDGAMNWVFEGTQQEKQQFVSRTSDGSALVVRYFPAHALVEAGTHNVTGAGESCLCRQNESVTYSLM